MKERKVEVVSISRDIHGKITTLLRITFDGEIHMVKTENIPQCYGRWGAWALTSGSACNYCKFMQYCQEDTMKKLLEKAKEQEKEEIETNLEWTREDRFPTE